MYEVNGKTLSFYCIFLKIEQEEKMLQKIIVNKSKLEVKQSLMYEQQLNIKTFRFSMLVRRGYTLHNLL
jgi:hypothetical protein